MKYRRLFALLTLFALLLELSDSSTNFIRANVGTTSFVSQSGTSGFNLVKAIFHFDGDQDGQNDDDENSSPAHFNDVSVHYSYPATSFVFVSAIVQSVVFTVFVEIFIDQYYPSIFQPPKIA